jgi:outer membrane lipoprotein-sorting protein
MSRSSRKTFRRLRRNPIVRFFRTLLTLPLDMWDQVFSPENQDVRKRRKRRHLRRYALYAGLAIAVAVFIYWNFMLPSGESSAEDLKTLRSLTADQVVKRYADVSGGVEAQMNLRALFVKGHLHTPEEVLKMRIYKKAPNFLRMEYISSEGTTIQAHDGQTVWAQTLEGQIIELQNPKARERFLRDSPIQTHLLLTQVHDYPFELIGLTEVDGANCFAVEVQLPIGDTIQYFIDAQTYLERKIMTGRSDAENPTGNYMRQSQYKKINGFNVPQKLVSFEDGKWINTFYVESVSFNPGLVDSFFLKPE